MLCASYSSLGKCIALLVAAQVNRGWADGLIDMRQRPASLKSYTAGRTYPAGVFMKPLPVLICNDRAWLATLTQQVPELACATVIEHACDCQQAPLCAWLQPPAPSTRGHIHGVLADAIATLERTRHAFRSRELGELRKRLQSLQQTLSADAQ